MVGLGTTTALPPLNPGQELLNGRFSVKGVIGSGSMGVVYRADDRDFGREVALKTLVNFDADRLYQLKREFRTLERLTHPNLVRLYSLGTSGDIWFVTMELLEGLELSAWLRKKPSRERVLRVFGELADGLRALHAAGLMHRDVKPTNVMVSSGDHAVLLDFGLAAPIRSTIATMTAGTLDYMAPEQLWNESPGASADWYSFGAVLFEALTGTVPFSGPDRLKAMQKPIKAGPRAFLPDIPTALDDMVRRLLDPNPRQRPGPGEIAELLELTPTSADAAPVLPRAPFVGRADALRRLRVVFEGVTQGTLQVVHVHGPSGIGKTTLVRQFLSEVGESTEALVLEGSCHPHESVPYKALDALIDNLARYLLGVDRHTVLALAPRHAAALLHVFPVLGRVPAVREWPALPVELSPSEQRRRSFDALRELIGKLADQRPVVLWIDDIQWSDRDSGVMLGALLAPPDSPSLLLLLTSRDDDVESPLLSMLAPAVVAADLRLDPMSPEESADLARALTQAEGLERMSDTIAAEAHGSPFLLGELVRYLREPRVGTHAGQPLTVAEVVRSRFRRLTGPGRRLFDVVAIAGRPLEEDLALEVAGVGRAGRLLAYSLCSESLLRITTQDQHAFFETYHDRFREFALADLSTDEKRALHYALAEGIRGSRKPDARALVRHYVAADDRSQAAHFARLAAQEAERDLAFDQAVDMYDVVLAVTPGAESDADVMERRAGALANGARRTEAALAYEAAARAMAAGGETRTAIHVRAAEQFFYGGELRRGLEVLERVLEDVGIRIPRRPLARALGGQWRRARFIVRGSRMQPREPASIPLETRVRLDALWRATRGIVMLDPTLADVLAGTHLLEGLRSGDRSRALRAVGLEAAFEANIGGRWFRRRSQRLLAEADRSAAAHGDAYDLAWLSHCRAACAWFDGRWVECVRLSEDAEVRLRHAGVGTAWELTVLQGFLLSALAHLGRLRELSQKVHELVTDAERRHDLYALRVFRTGDAVMTWLAADQVDMALQISDETLRDYPADQFTSQHRHHLVASVQSHLYAGNAEQAWACVERAWPSIRWSGFLLLDCLGTQLRYLKACAALAMARAPSCGSPARFLRIARHEARRIRRSALPMASPMAAAIDAGVSGTERNPDAQIVALTSAAEGFALADMTLHQQAARRHLSTLAGDDARQPDTSAAWMAQQGIVRPSSIARAVVPPA
jgi:hypothetical protein